MKKLCITGALFASLFALSSATTFIWDGGSSGLLTDSANWADGGTPSIEGKDTVVFNSSVTANSDYWAHANNVTVGQNATVILNLGGSQIGRDFTDNGVWTIHSGSSLHVQGLHIWDLGFQGHVFNFDITSNDKDRVLTSVSADRATMWAASKTLQFSGTLNLLNDATSISTYTLFSGEGVKGWHYTTSFIIDITGFVVKDAQGNDYHNRGSVSSADDLQNGEYGYIYDENTKIVNLVVNKSIPEPSGFALCCVGLAGLVFRRKRG